MNITGGAEFEIHASPSVCDEASKRETRMPKYGGRWDKIDDLTEEEWSPEQLGGRFKTEDNGPVRHEWIFEHVCRDEAEGGDLYTNRRHPSPSRKEVVDDGRGQHANQTSNEKRPEIVDETVLFGDREADLVMGANHQEALVTMVERTTLYALIGNVKTKDS